MRPRILPVLGVALLTAGCLNQSMDDLTAYIAEVKARHPGPIDPIPEIKPVETFTYLPLDRRSPFVPEQPEEEETPEEQILAGGPRPDEFRTKEELETFPLDSVPLMFTFVPRRSISSCSSDLS